MASKSDIEAGKAHVLLYVKDTLTKGLRAGQEKLQSFGAGMMKIGAGMTAMGASITAPFVAIVNRFTELGGAIDDIAQRTGQSAQSIAELGYAAKLSGAGMEDIEKAILKMQQNGITETFDQVAERIAAMTDPAERTKAAMEAWGKSGVKLLPMVGNLKALREEAHKMGAVPDDETMGFATAMGDAMDRIKAVVDGMVMSVGAALGPVLLPALETITNIVATISKWVKENGALIRTVFLIGAGLTAAGAAVTAIGAIVFGLGAAFGALATVIGAIGSVLAAAFSPIGLAVIAITAATIAFFKFTEAGKQAASSIMGFFAPLFDLLKQGFGGIADALMAGEIGLAAEIAVKTIQAVFQTGLASLANAIGGTLGDVLGSVGTDLINGDFAKAWQTALTGVGALWDSLVASMLDSFAGLVNRVVELWNNAISVLRAGVLGIGNIVRNSPLGDLTGGAFDAIGGGLTAIQAGGNIVGGKVSSVADALATNAKGNAAASESAFRERIGGGADKASDAAGELAKELDDLRKRAAEARAAAFAESPELPGAGDVSEMAKQTFSTFSAAAALLQGGAQGANERTARATEAMAKRQEEANAKLDGIHARLGVT